MDSTPASKLKTFCISHVKDVDGLGAASIVLAATKARFLLSDYADLIENLRKVPGDVGHLVLCDLGTDNSELNDFLREIGRIARRAKVTYIDHHYVSESTKKRLDEIGVRLVHDDRECSSMLAYHTFRDSLPEGARLIALCGAVTDYTDDSPMARPMMEQADRQYVLLESSMLAYALSQLAREKGFARKIVVSLSKMKQPHQIPGIPSAAVKQLSDVYRLGRVVKKGGKKLGRLAYMITDQYSTGNVAKLLIGAFEVPVGVALKEQEKGWYEVSLRGTSESRIHLGRTISEVASRLGGSGGGHRKAAGCRIPVGAMQEMIETLAKKV